MIEIDCSNILKPGTDFAFDHLRDDIQTDDELTLNYEKQTVHIHSTNEELAKETRRAIERRAVERFQDMKREIKSGFEVGFSIERLNTAISNSTDITVTEK